MKHWARISKEVQFDAGHRVPRHSSKCKNPHGHRYRIVAHCRGWIINDPTSSDDGMLIDFGELKSILTIRVHDVLDHGFIVHKNDFVMLDALQSGRDVEEWNVIEFPYVPTAENIARWIWEEIEPVIKEHFRGNLMLDHIECWETPTSCAYYPQEVH